MNAFLRTCLFCWGVLCGWAVQAAEPAVAVYYGNKASLSELSLYDIAVVEPGHGYDPVQFRKQAPGSELYAYASVAEVLPERAYFSKIPEAWKMARNGAWQSIVLDQTPAQWPAFFADEVIAPLWKQGFRGFFLDTLDSYRLAANFDEKAQQDGLVRVIETLHQRYPGIRLILNRGFEIVPRVRDKVQMVAAESLLRGWDASLKRYVNVPEKDREWLLQQLQTIRERDRLPVLSIDYVAPHDRDATRETARRIAQLGIIPWVSDAGLQTLGIGQVEAVARRVLILYNGADYPSINGASAHRFLEMPINYMGYVADYADVREPPARRRGARPLCRRGELVRRRGARDAGQKRAAVAGQPGAAGHAAAGAQYAGAVPGPHHVGRPGHAQHGSGTRVPAAARRKGAAHGVRDTAGRASARLRRLGVHSTDGQGQP